MFVWNAINLTVAPLKAAVLYAHMSIFSLEHP